MTEQVLTISAQIERFWCVHGNTRLHGFAPRATPRRTFSFCHIGTGNIHVPCALFAQPQPPVATAWLPSAARGSPQQESSNFAMGKPTRIAAASTLPEAVFATVEATLSASAI